MIICKSTNCVYRYRCCRQTRSDPDDIDQTAYNFEYNGCDSENGYPDYIKDNEVNY